jgi:hypothetical protein
MGMGMGRFYLEAEESPDAPDISHEELSLTAIANLCARNGLDNEDEVEIYRNARSCTTVRGTELRGQGSVP